MARRLVAEDPRFGGRGRPAFLITTPIFLRTMGLGSLAGLVSMDDARVTAFVAACTLLESGHDGNV